MSRGLVHSSFWKNGTVRETILYVVYSQVQRIDFCFFSSKFLETLLAYHLFLESDPQCRAQFCNTP